jgi:hypothetical protein
VAVDSYDRALWVQSGEELREEMERYFHGRPQAVRVRIMGVGKGDARATVTASVTYSDGSEAHVPVAVTKGDPAWLGFSWLVVRRAGREGEPSDRPREASGVRGDKMLEACCILNGGGAWITRAGSFPALSHSPKGFTP